MNLKTIAVKTMGKTIIPHLSKSQIQKMKDDLALDAMMQENWKKMAKRMKVEILAFEPTKQQIESLHLFLQPHEFTNLLK